MIRANICCLDQQIRPMHPDGMGLSHFYSRETDFETVKLHSNPGK